MKADDELTEEEIERLRVSLPLIAEAAAQCAGSLRELAEGVRAFNAAMVRLGVWRFYPH